MNEKKITYVIKSVKIHYHSVLNTSINICALNLPEHSLNESKSCTNTVSRTFRGL